MIPLCSVAHAHGPTLGPVLIAAVLLAGAATTIGADRLLRRPQS